MVSVRQRLAAPSRGASQAAQNFGILREEKGTCYIPLISRTTISNDAYGLLLTAPWFIVYSGAFIKSVYRGFYVYEINGYCVNRCRQGDPPAGSGLIIVLPYPKKLFRFKGRLVSFRLFANRSLIENLSL
jgi:hypothetical protein